MFKRNLLTAICVISFGLSTILYNGSTVFYLDEVSAYPMLIGLFFLCGIVHLLGEKKIKITGIQLEDALFIICIAIFFLSILRAGHLSLHEDGLLLCAIIAVSFITARTLFQTSFNIRIIFGTLMILFWIEAGWSYIQLLEKIMGNKASHLSMQGSFYNSGILSTFLVINLPIHYLFYVTEPKKLFKWNYFAALLAAILAVLISASRSGIIAIAALVIFQHREMLKSKFTSASAVLKIILVLSAGLITLASIAVLFTTKGDSSLGRILIWRITVDKALGSPITGCGFGNFQTLYTKWQAEFFKNHSGENAFIKVADFSYTCFNEPLQLFAETGIPGLTASIAFAVLTARRWFKQPHDLTRGCFFNINLLILLFSFFSYPLHSFPILYLFIFSVAGLTGTTNEHITRYQWSSKWVRLVLVTGCCGISLWLSQRALHVYEWQVSRTTVFEDDDLLATRYAQLYEKLNTLPTFLADYSRVCQQLQNNKFAERLLENSKEMLATENTYLLLGKIYEDQKNFNKAISVYQELSLIVPNRFIPKARIANIYYTLNDTSMAKAIARSALRMPVKIASAETNEARAQLQSILYAK